ncbi:hypothetical protein Ae406Ps2_6071c [Pseudonocardia sp. Ae406_Ps2]|nr:hypothetical protein Ae406Ps2_6071c [Pseudonocardia sp. Ae406_Ps2]
MPPDQFVERLRVALQMGTQQVGVCNRRRCSRGIAGSSAGADGRATRSRRAAAGSYGGVGTSSERDRSFGGIDDLGRRARGGLHQGAAPTPMSRGNYLVRPCL